MNDCSTSSAEVISGKQQFTNNSSSRNYPYSSDHVIRYSRFQPFTMLKTKHLLPNVLNITYKKVSGYHLFCFGIFFFQKCLDL